MKPTFVTEYRAQLTLNQPRCQVTITGATPADVQNAITQFLGGKTKTSFDAQQNDNTVLIYNDQHFNGEKPIGYISEMAVPNPWSVASLAEHRLNLVQKAA